MLRHTMTFDRVTCDTKDKALRRVPKFKAKPPDYLSLSTPEIIRRITLGRMYTSGEIRKNVGSSNKYRAHNKSIFVFDIDNKTDAVSFSDIKRLFDSRRIHMFFAYETYSNTDELPRYRILFAFDKAYNGIYVKRIQNAIHLLIESKYPGILDTSCFDDTHTFFGCSSERNVLFQDPNAVTFLFQIHEIYQDIMNQRLSEATNSLKSIRTLRTMKTSLSRTSTALASTLVAILIETGNCVKTEAATTRHLLITRGSPSTEKLYPENSHIDARRGCCSLSSNSIATKMSATADYKRNIDASENEEKSFVRLLYRLDLVKILNQKNRRLRCVLPNHEDVHPSAYIKTSERGVSLYCCSSCTNRGITIIELTRRLFTDINLPFEVHTIDAYFWLVNQLGLTKDNLRFRLLNSEAYLNDFQSKTNLSKISPSVANWLYHSKIRQDVFRYIVSEAIKYGYNPHRFDMPYLCTSISDEYISNHCNPNQKYPKSTVRQEINNLLKSGLIENVSDEELSQYVSVKLDKVKRNGRRISFYRIPIYSMDFVKEVEKCLSEHILKRQSSVNESIEDIIYRYAIDKITVSGYVSIKELIAYFMDLKSCKYRNAVKNINKFVDIWTQERDLELLTYNKTTASLFAFTEPMNPGSSKFLCRKERT